MWFKTDMCWSTLLNTSVESGTHILRQRYIMDLFLVWDGFFFSFSIALNKKEYFRAVLNTLKSVTSTKKFWYLLNNSVEFFGNNNFIEKY